MLLVSASLRACGVGTKRSLWCRLEEELVVSVSRGAYGVGMKRSLW